MVIYNRNWFASVFFAKVFLALFSFILFITLFNSNVDAQSVRTIAAVENSSAVDNENLESADYQGYNPRSRLRGLVPQTEENPDKEIVSKRTDLDFEQEDELDADSGEPTSVLNAQNMEISSLVKLISRLSKRNYVIDPAVRGKVTIHQPTPMSVSQVLDTFEAVLLHKGFTSVPIGNNTWKIVRAKDARETTIPLLFETPKETSDALVTQLFNLEHVQADEISGVIKRFVAKSGSLDIFPGTNSLIIVDSARNLERIKSLVKKLDVPDTLRQVKVFPLEHAEAPDLAQKINDILARAGAAPTMGLRSQPAERARRRGSSRLRRERASNRQQKSENSVFADERTNSLIAVASLGTLEQVKQLVDLLDSPVDLSGGQFHVYQLKHADADELVEVLNTLIQPASSSVRTPNRAKTGSSLSRNRRQSQERQDSKAQRSSSSAGRVSFENDVSLAPESRTNSIIINASPTDYLRLESLIKQLDVRRKQVLVEASIIEVTLNNDSDLGVELQGAIGGGDGALVGQSNFGSLTSFFQNPANVQDLTIAAASQGTLTLPGGLVLPSQTALINALSSHSNVNVLSSPSVLTSDNDEAEIIVGENVPFVTSTSTDPTNLSNTFNQIERHDVGITLRITPQITNGDAVTLSIFVEISNVVPGTRNAENGPTTTIRTTETTVVVKNGQMVVTGGLMADNVTKSERGVPLLKEIPVLGSLFKREEEQSERTNLLIFITPRIIHDGADAQRVTDIMHKRMKREVGEENQLIPMKSRLSQSYLSDDQF